MDAKPTPNYYKLIRINRNDGRLTTVSLDPKTVAKAVQVLGGLRLVTKLVRDLALQYVDGTAKNCSSYVEEQLMKTIKMANSGLPDAQSPIPRDGTDKDFKTSLRSNVEGDMPLVTARRRKPKLSGQPSQEKNSSYTSATLVNMPTLEPLSPDVMDLLLKCAKYEHRTASNMLEFLVIQHAKRIQLSA